MKNKWMKFGLIFGFVSLIVGLALGAIGLSNKGVEQLKAATKPQEVHLTFDSVESLDIQLYEREIIIEPTSPDDKVHVTYQNLENVNYGLDINENNKKLTIHQKTVDFTVFNSPLTLAGEALNYEDTDYLVTVQVPKGTELKKIYNGNATWQFISVKDINVQELTGTAGFHLENVTISKAELSGWANQFYAEDSHIKNLTLNASGSSGINLINTTLEDSTITSDNWINNFYTNVLTIVGDVDIQVVGGTIELGLTADSKKTIDFDIKLEEFNPRQYVDEDGDWLDNEDDVEWGVTEYYDENGDYLYETESRIEEALQLTIADDIKKDAETDKAFEFKKTVKNAKGKLTIKGTGPNHITIK